MNVMAMVALTLGLVVALCGNGPAGEVLYNGIVLPEKWPPHYSRPPDEPMPVPYLANPPKVIPIDVGRQLFVDDFLIEQTTLERTFHRAEPCPDNPILKADRPWENVRRGGFAAPFSGGVWFDPKDGLFKMWYCGGYLASLCYARSRDGIHWEKPSLDFEPGTNILFRPGLTPNNPRHDTTTVWLDHDATNPKERFKYFATESDGKRWQLVMRVSADGIHWSDPVASQPIGGDRTTVFYNPFRKVWVISERITWNGRARAYTEAPDPRAAIAKVPKAHVRWVAGEKDDPRNPDPKWHDIHPQLYNLDATPYESIMLGLFVIWQGPSNAECHRLRIQKRNEVLLGFSRDGFHWSRPYRKPFIEVNPTEGAWNWGNVQCVGGGCLVVGDRLFFYYSGRAKPKKEWDADASTGLAFLRRDGFASMDADARGGTLTTRPVRFKGRFLFVNVDCPRGELRVEVLGADGKPIPPFTAENCVPLSCDNTLAPVTWRGARDLSPVAGKPVRLRFRLKNGSLYAFWVSPEKSGASHGFVAAGGPGFTGPTDTVGIRALRQATR